MILSDQYEKLTVKRIKPDGRYEIVAEITDDENEPIMTTADYAVSLKPRSNKVMNIAGAIGKIMTWKATQSASEEEVKHYASKLLLEELRLASPDDISNYLCIDMLKEEGQFKVTLSFPWPEALKRGESYE